ncbi:MAG: type II secretion system secretin GspD [Myxococcota bacterium]
MSMVQTARAQAEALLLFGAVLVATPALAQDPAPVPLKKLEPIIDKNVLAIPGNLPAIKANSKPAVAPGLKPQMAPAPAPAPAPADANKAAPVGFGDFKTEADKNCRPLLPNDKVPFEFKDADIKDVVTAISKTMCKNFIITSKVRSQKFDIVSPTRIRVDEAWQAFLSALEANDFAVFQVGRFYKIIQGNDATRAPVSILDDKDRVASDDRMVTKIWKISSGQDLNQIVNYLNIFKSNKGQIHPYSATNVIVATDYASSIERAERILDEIDLPSGAAERVHVVSVDFASATEIAEKLTQIFEPAKAPAAGAPKAGNRASGPAEKKLIGKRSGAEITAMLDTYSVSKIIADDRTNRLIIIASDEAFKQVMALKKKIDVPSDGAGEGQVHVLRLKNANADELASTLASLASGRPTSGKSSSRLGSGKAPAPAAGAAAGGAAGAQASLFQGDVKITADKPTNSLVITASKGDYASLRRVIDQLDVPRLQVFVEAAILEVAIKRDRTLGTGWHGGANPQIGGKDSPIVFGSQPSKGLSSLAATQNPASLVSLLGFAGALRGPTVPGTETLIPGGLPSVGAILEALQTTNDVNIVSTPQVLTMDNEEAEIKVAEKRPFSNGLLGGLGGLGSLAGLAGASNPALGQAASFGSLLGGGLGSVSRETVGLTLKLKPQINDQSSVRLEIDQELSDVTGQDQATGNIITSERTAKTVVVAHDQESVVIGGLVKDRVSTDESKVPLLGDIPLLGWLFKSQTKRTDKVNLVLVLTPYIIRGPGDFYKIYQQKMAERKEFVERYFGPIDGYEAKIDWDRKPGPIAQYRLELRNEMMKAENGGPGLDGDLIITPEKKKKSSDDDDDSKDGIVPPETTGGDTGAPPPAAPPPAEAPPPTPDIPPAEVNP